MGKEGRGICLKKPSTKSLPKHLLAVWQMAGVRHREKEFTQRKLCFPFRQAKSKEIQERFARLCSRKASLRRHHSDLADVTTVSRGWRVVLQYRLKHLKYHRPGRS